MDHKPASGRPSAARLAIALLLAAAGLAGLWLLWAPTLQTAVPPETARADVPEPHPVAKTAGTVAGNAAPAAPAPEHLPEGDADPTRDLSSYVARGENPTMAQVIDGLHQRGIHTGLGAFSPPGTSPPLVGLAVPDDFALPKGYVRHHQATDDGQRIDAILMFAPGFQLTGPDNKPVAMPANRVVPPELAPPGLPIRRIVIPPPNDPNNPTR